MLISIVLGTILSALMAHLAINIKWGHLVSRFTKKDTNTRRWEKLFNKMILFESLRLGNLINKGGKKKSHQHHHRAKEEEKETLDKNEGPNQETRNILSHWHQCNYKLIKQIKTLFKTEGHLDVSEIPLKLYMREISLQNGQQNLQGKHLSNNLTLKLFLKVLREEILGSRDLNKVINLNEKMNIHNSVILHYILKKGGNEKRSRQQIIDSPKSLLSKLKSFSRQGLDNADKEIISHYSSVKLLLTYFKSEARKQIQFEIEYKLNKAKGHKKSRGDKKHPAPLNPQKYQDALQILEMEPLFDLKVLKKKYKEMALKYHPDRASAQGNSNNRLAHEKFIKINNAFQTLSKKCS